eukprot:CAMPEP_0175039038 /NCGR_PEP_ID=MMETSP0052_2-20121109/284_1 /TAXON_ID=51329 ORGANISM="Polytomella parva, Strain SAG 63-3" /NCGR_SAMPLE_ID=MMETSP0052_2 /ASSEMBLY_ACC=CAM_ASM_000194 /LENGTH=30 /DNA_ID= /DNA_START= /DNA_END= /DNA_ORIENTATION=
MGPNRKSLKRTAIGQGFNQHLVKQMVQNPL